MLKGIVGQQRAKQLKVKKKAMEDQWEEKIKRPTVIGEPSSSPHLILGDGYSPFMLELLLSY